MTKVANAFDSFLRNLELTKKGKKDTSRHTDAFRKNLRERLGIVRDVLSGSFARRTAIRPLNDIDLFVILDPVVHKASYPPAEPIVCLRTIEKALKEAYPKHTAKIQGRSVHIAFTGTGIGYDVVPAFAERQGGECKIPDRNRKEWIRTNRVLQRCPEPSRIGPNIDFGMTQAERTAARNALLEAAKAAKDALVAEKSSQIEKAHVIWRTLLGDDYPEKGH